MLYCDRIDISKATDLAKSNRSKECMISQYWFFNHGFKFQDSIYNGCHDLMMLCLNISDIAIITVKIVDYRCIVCNISKSEVINLLKNSVLEDCGYYFFSFAIYKMVDGMDIYKSLNISTGTVMRNPEMLKFVPDHLGTKKKKSVRMQLKNYLIY